ncbi:hypothetical protein PC119_g3696 [Phytophthora cactorum]|nr:hypothetical protein PC119_g3696 [Phytophthora cactorum]
MSLWTDHAAQVLWLDSDYPVTADPKKPGVSRGTCAKTSGVPKEVIAEQAEATVAFSNIRVGDIGSTVKGVGTSKTTTTKKTTTTPATETANEADPEVGADADPEEVGADADTETGPSTSTSSCKRRH